MMLRPMTGGAPIGYRAQWRWDALMLLLYQVIFLVLYCQFLWGKGTLSMFDPVL